SLMTCRDPPTVNVVAVVLDAPDWSNEVTRTVEAAGPGFATATHACQPLPPPWGQNHAPVAGPVTAAADARPPTWVRHHPSPHPDAPTRPTTSSTASRRRPTRIPAGGSGGAVSSPAGRIVEGSRSAMFRRPPGDPQGQRPEERQREHLQRPDPLRGVVDGER